MTTRADFMDSVDLIKNRIIELTQERDQLRRRVADLEAQVEASTGDGWTYVEDEMPPAKTPLLLTCNYPEIDEPFVATGEWNSHPNLGDWWSLDADEIIHPQIIAWKLAPQPAPLRTAARATGIAAGEDGE